MFDCFVACRRLMLIPFIPRLPELVDSHLKKGLHVYLVERATQLEHASLGMLSDDLRALLSGPSASSVSAAPAPSSMLPIGVMRTVLQFYLAAFVGALQKSEQRAAVTWVLDDDKRLLRLQGV